MLRMNESPQFTLVLGGGGLKGLTHIGALRALAERNLEPQAVIGCSMGSLVASAWAVGMSLEEMEKRALAVTRKDVFRIAHFDMALKRMLSPAIYRREPLDHLIQSITGDVTFQELSRQLVVNTVDLNTGQQVLWGLPGLQAARVADAVFASCALPGILPPRSILGRVCVDGAVLENLPVRAALAISRVMHIIAIVCLGALAWVTPLSPAYLIGVGIVGMMLAYEQSLVRPDDLSQVKRAFDMNGYVGILYLAVLAISM